MSLHVNYDVWHHFVLFSTQISSLIKTLCITRNYIFYMHIESIMQPHSKLINVVIYVFFLPSAFEVYTHFTRFDSDCVVTLTFHGKVLMLNPHGYWDLPIEMCPHPLTYNFNVICQWKHHKKTYFTLHLWFKHTLTDTHAHRVLFIGWRHQNRMMNGGIMLSGTNWLVGFTCWNVLLSHWQVNPHPINVFTQYRMW